jgi:hypothetical protein
VEKIDMTMHAKHNRPADTDEAIRPLLSIITTNALSPSAAVVSGSGHATTMFFTIHKYFRNSNRCSNDLLVMGSTLGRWRRAKLFHHSCST